MTKGTLTDTPPPTAQRQWWWGLALLVVGNVCFSTKAILIKLLYAEGVDTFSVIALRMLLSFPIYLVVAFGLHRRSDNVRLTGREWLTISALGILGYYVSSTLDFLGLQYVTASVERLVLFTYPTIVLLLSAWWFHQKISAVQWGALLLTYSGVVLVFVAESGFGIQQNLLKGGSLVFACAITYAVYVVYAGAWTRRVGSAKFAAYSMLAATVPAVLQSFWHNGLDVFHYSPKVYQLSVWIALVATVLPAFLVNEGIRLVGAGDSGIIGFVGPVSTILLAWWILGEPISVLQLLGTAVVLSGVFLLSRKKPTEGIRSTE